MPVVPLLNSVIPHRKRDEDRAYYAPTSAPIIAPVVFDEEVDFGVGDALVPRDVIIAGVEEVEVAVDVDENIEELVARVP